MNQRHHIDYNITMACQEEFVNLLQSIQCSFHLQHVNYVYTTFYNKTM